MGVFDFLKRFSRKEEEIKEIKLDELNDFVDSYSKKIIDGIKNELEDINKKINLEKKKSKENLEVLDKAELRNKNVPERVKQIIDGNRQTYIQKVNMLIEKINLPEDFDKIKVYCDSFDNGLEFFGKNTLRSYQVLQEFFGDESGAIAENIRDLGKLIKGTKSILENAKMDKIMELKNKIKETKQKAKKKIEFKWGVKTKKSELKKISDKIDEDSRRMKKIENENEHKKFIGLVDKTKILKQNVSELEKELWHSFSVIGPALKKYERITLEKELTKKYLTNSLKTLLNDSELKVVKLLEKMRNAVMDRKIELKDKKMEKILNELNKLNIDYFDGFLRRYNKLKNELDELKSKIDASKIVKEVEKIKEELEYYKDKLKSTKTRIKEITEELEEIDIKELKKKLEKRVFDSINKKITIL